ncbi:MAG TPA: TetR/AcrR family transcriptional regulator [Solirubrobacterales bacterium]|jgi:AcrR family transcriptional regulator
MRPEPCAAAGEALPVEAEAASAAEVREGAMEGVLVVAGELGYRAASVRAILDYSGGHRRQFYEQFASKEDCFEQAHSAWMSRVGVELLEAAMAAPRWQESVRAALIRLFWFVTRHPQIARSLFVEVQVAGGGALAEHNEAMERIAQALDSVRAEIEPGQEPPEATGLFVAGGVEACLCDALTAGEPSRIWDALPELMHMAVGSYLNPAAAEAAFEDAKALLERDRDRLESGEAA